MAQDIILNQFALCVCLPEEKDGAIDALSNLEELGHELSSCACILLVFPHGLQLKQLLEGRFQSFRAAIRPISSPHAPFSVEAINMGLEICKSENWDALTLMPGVRLLPGSISKLREVAAQEPMIGFANPRSNGNDFSSLPGSDAILDFARACENFRAVRGGLLSWRIVPNGSLFCAYVKAQILREFGVFDPAYGFQGDLFLKANRCGYRVALCNGAFAYRMQETYSEPKSRKTLDKLYPELKRAVFDYRHEAEVEHERSICLSRSRAGRKSLLIDLSHVGPFHNGTIECAKGFLSGWATLKSSGRLELDLFILISDEAARFHEIARRFPSFSVLDKNAELGLVFDYALRMGQPSSYQEVRILSQKAIYNFYLMLDSIAWDCFYIRTPGLDLTWNFVADHMNGLVFISGFSRAQFERRFLKDRTLPLCTALLSTARQDYIPRELSATTPHPLGGRAYLLVIGNHFDHKFVGPTADALAARFPDVKVCVLGKYLGSNQSVIAMNSGGFNPSAMHSLYHFASAVIYPSHYEGFGLPVIESLVRGKTVFVRDLPVNQEIIEKWNGEGEIVLYGDTVTLLSKLEGFFNGKPDQGIRFGNDVQKREPWDWSASAQVLVDFLHEVERGDPLALRSLSRMRAFQYVSEIERPPRLHVPVRDRVHLIVHGVLHHFYKYPKLKLLIRSTYRLVSKGRAREGTDARSLLQSDDGV